MKVKKAHKIRLYLLLWLLTVTLTLLAGIAMPKYAVRFWGFQLFITLELVLWFNFRKYLQNKKQALKTFLSIVYWLPLLLLGAYIVGISLKPPEEWNDFIRIYYTAFMVIMYVGKMLFGIILLIAALVYLINHYVKKTFLLRIWKGFITTGLVLWGILALLMIAGMLFGTRNCKVQKEELSFKELPAQFSDYRIVQISDLHLGTMASVKPLAKIVNQINALDPDLIVFTGDLVNDQTSEAYPFKAELSKLKARDGILCILGNHDYGEYRNWTDSAAKEQNNKDLAGLFKEMNWQLLKNSSVIIKYQNDSIAVLGVENWSSHLVFGRKGDLKKAYSGTENVQFKILLTHDPSHWKAQVMKDFDDIALTLSGHTHAMQMGIETSWLKWSPSVWLFKEWGGLYSQQNSSGVEQFLYVNRGTGQLMYPGRLGIPPEITLIVLKQK